jgi:SAM-dependent methyltransferase
MRSGRKILEQGLGRPIANMSFAMMHGYVRSIQRRGVAMMHTARPFAYYRKVFYQSQPKSAVLKSLQNKRVVDVGCGYTPYAEDSMFRACHDADIEFYGVDPLIGTDIKFGFKERAVARATGGSGHFSTHPPGLAKALSASAQELPFEDQSVDELLCSYLLFVWIEDEEVLADILDEFLRILKPGGLVKLYPLYEWRFMRLKNKRLKNVLVNFKIEQTFVHGGRDLRVTPSMLTEMTKV